ncbi:hypothetical protein B0T16DRAFT_186115 [Cercophora newfieldiana]|uniref:SigF-like NTF2-like domain-containing protein n=1 Tax=Cercophora newfieldiana TaxID=92897 RepID=A0AA39Y1D0_9PEZI|nr:hypothetical protein B0T16DRAFT_186115 [Cercophora newfieldiana]
MEHPVRDIRGVIRSLTQGTPEEQQDAINRYYLPSASFVHPFCRVPSFENKRLPLLGSIDSRMLVLAIYKWYKILSPKIDIHIESTVFDQRANLLYVTLHQTFSIWFLPFHKSPVRLVTVLHLAPDSTTPAKNNGTLESPSLPDLPPLGESPTEPSFADVASPETNTAVISSKASKAHVASSPSPFTTGTRRYRIKKQEDLYQVNEFLKFILMGPGAVVYGWFQLVSAIACVVGVLVLGPVLGMLGFGRRVPAAVAPVPVQIRVPELGAPLMSMMVDGNGEGEGVNGNGNERESRR